MADVDLTVTIPDAWVDRVLNAVIDNASVGIEIRINYGPALLFSYTPKQGGETNKDFGERWLRSLGRAFVRASELNEDTNRYNTEIGAIAPPAEAVPEEIII